ncbi:HD domain-containing protein [Tepidibacter formicigenes]|jgi:3'-5' exoribonuclease|uniref:3'-5' exoribonuclease n=1 Tax=Tepidibacter formicigenes DSM 15518 TaxID=1123349 RepID=A0A1M6SJA2_9FIRM|nr:HD domain-containing protein [Tepidibacter formicigenes]SHK44773.1 3'-5' exoribonuclease [Tepidibacter formicigenes DSM 15518]
MKNKFMKDLKENESVESMFMIMKKIYRQDGKLIAYIGDKTGEIKASIQDKENSLEVGDVIKVKGIKRDILQVDSFKKQKNFDIEKFLPTISKPIDEIMDEIYKISEEEFKSEESKVLDRYFFKNNDFIEKFKKGIGGLRQHHNYIGGLAEHTLNVMYMAKTMAYRYDCRNKEIAILGAKLHDIGKIEEYSTNGIFSTTMRGDIEGHIIIGISMLEDAFRIGGSIYSEDFKMRIKGCIVQHHGKLEYGSPKSPNTEEAFIVHYADYIDANLNKIGQVRNTAEANTWSEYDRRIGTKLYV